MNSGDLEEYGISDWIPINPDNRDKVTASLPAQPGVYVFRGIARLFSRVQSESDIVYVGRAMREGGVSARVREHFVPGSTGTPSGRLYQFAEEWGYHLEVGWAVPDDPKQVAIIEREIIERFEEDHRDSPPVNRSMPSG